MKQRLLIMVLVSLLVGNAAGMVPDSSAAAPAVPPDLVILYTGDGRGSIDPLGCCSKIGGMARRLTIIEKFKKENQQVLIVDTGDFLSPRKNSSCNAIRLEANRKEEQIIQYDAMNVAENEIISADDRCLSESELFNQQQPMLSANVYFTSDECRQLPPYLIKGIGELKIGITGLAVPAKNTLSLLPDAVEFRDPLVSLTKALEALRTKVDIIILLSHLGWEGSLEIVQAMPDIDIVIVGHGYYPDFEPHYVGSTLMVKNAFEGGLIGIIDVWTNDVKKIERTQSRLELLSMDIRPAPEYQEMEFRYSEDWKKCRDQSRVQIDLESVKKNLDLSPEEYFEMMNRQNQ